MAVPEGLSKKESHILVFPNKWSRWPNIPSSLLSEETNKRRQNAALFSCAPGKLDCVLLHNAIQYVYVSTKVVLNIMGLLVVDYITAPNI